MVTKTQAVSDSVVIDESITNESIGGTGNVTIRVSDAINIDESADTSINVKPTLTQPSLVKAVIETYASDGSVSSRKFADTLIDAEITKDGDRAVDTATFAFPIQTSVAQNNGILYIQDVVDTRFLRGIWNFHYSLVDEAGNALDGTSANEDVSLYDPTVGTSMGIDNYGGNNGGTSSFVARKILANGDQVTVANASNIIDLSKQFDILIHFSCLTNADSNANPKYLFDTQHGGGTGLAIFLSATGVMTVQKNGGVDLIVGTTTNLNDEKWHFVRLTRDANNSIRLFVDGVQEGSTVNSSESYQNSAADVTFGTTSASVTNRILHGTLLQVRIYCGGVLNDVDANTVFASNPQPYTMKFGGVVWKIEDSTDSKIAYCKSFAKQLGDIELSFNNLTTATGSPPTSPYIANNVYVGKTGDLIIKDFVSNVLSGWIVRIVPTFGTTITKYVASGSFLTNLFYLLYTESNGVNGGRLTFFTTARKVMIIEFINKDHTVAPGALNFTGVQSGGKYTVTDDGVDDTSYVNDVQVTGTLMTASFHETDAPGVGVLRSKVLQFAPISATVQVPAGTYLKMDNSNAPAANTFQIDIENKQIVFVTAPNPATVVIDYVYEDTTSVVWRNSDATGITRNGRYSKQYNMIQMRDYFNMRNFAANVITRLGNQTGSTWSPAHTIPRRITVEAPTLINSIRENYYVLVTNGVKGVSDSTNFINGKYAIKQIIYKYKEGTTTIHLGDYLYDMFDSFNANSQNVDQNTQSYTKTKNV